MAALAEYFLGTPIPNPASEVFKALGEELPQGVLIGASGAIATLMGAFMLRLARVRIKFALFILWRPILFEAPAYIVLLIWLGLQVVHPTDGQKRKCQYLSSYLWFLVWRCDGLVDHS